MFTVPYQAFRRYLALFLHFSICSLTFLSTKLFFFPARSMFCLAVESPVRWFPSSPWSCISRYIQSETKHTFILFYTRLACVDDKKISGNIQRRIFDTLGARFLGPALKPPRHCQTELRKVPSPCAQLTENTNKGSQKHT